MKHYYSHSGRVIILETPDDFIGINDEPPTKIVFTNRALEATVAFYKQDPDKLVQEDMDTALEHTKKVMGEE